MSLFGGNADIKYPLDEFHEEVFPNTLILDLSLSLPEEYDPVLAAFRSGPGFAFLSIEDRSTGIPLACVIVQSPVLARVYPLEMSVAGHGWVAFGPGATQGDTFYSGEIEIGIDPEAVIPIVDRTDAVTFTGKLNGADMLISNILQIVSDNDTLTLTVSGNDITIDRNDDVLSQQDRIDLIDSEAGVNADVIFTIDGVLPDADGNIDIIVQGCAEPCLDTKALTVPRGDAGAGDQTELPLDVFQPKPFVAGDPCGESSGQSSVPEDTSGYDGCHALVTVPIKDRGNSDKAIGGILVDPTQDTFTTSSTVL